MEHLPLPSSSPSDLPRVPCVCRESLYDGGDFMAYPVRAGWPCVLQKGDELNWATAENLQPSDDKLLESFLQSWLFFGLLHHVLAPVQLYSPDDYLTASGDSLHVRTTSLENKLSSWLKLVRSFPPDHRARVLASLTQCLKLAHVAYQVTLLPSHQAFDKTIRLGLGAVYEAIEAAADMACDEKFDMLSVAPKIDELTRNIMISNGWCPAEISAAANDFCSLSGRIYLQYMRKPDVGIAHTTCTPEACTQIQSNLETYQPRHVTKGCHCENLGPKMDGIIACLEQDSFPLLTIDETGELEVRPFQSGMSYVALSHVWADGLGNPHEMALPRCQISKLRSLLTGVRQMTFQSGDDMKPSDNKELYLWCDTLCCPTSQPGKAAAMSKLRAVYQNSSCVLLLESTLAEYYRYSEMDQLEAMMRVLTSKWIRRLWTYQEAGLTRKLLVQFKDGPVDMKIIWDSVRLELKHRISGRYLYRNAAFGGSVLRTLFNQAPNLTHRIEEVEFAMAVRGLSYRRVSVQTDEALCLAAVFDLDMEAVLREDPERRMEIVWSLMLASKRGIPETMIFNEQPRLTSIGYRWAPATLQQPVTRFPTLPPRGDRIARAIAPFHGLPVSRPGYRIRLAGPPSCLSSNFSPPISPEHLLCRLRDSNGRWLNMYMDRYLGEGEQPSLLTLLQDRRRDWHLILEGSLGGNGLASQQRALLVYLDHHCSGLEISRSTAIVQVAYEQQGWDSFRQGIYPTAARLREMWPIQLLTVGHRCEMVFSAILSWFPALLRRPAFVMMNRGFSILGRAIARWIAARIQRQAELTSKIPRLAAWMKHMNAKRGTAATDVEDVEAFVLPIFMGRVATVLQEFGPEHVWYVD